MPAAQGVGVGVVVWTDKGFYAGGRGGGSFTFDDGTKEEFRRADWQANVDPTYTHMQNFIDAVAVEDHSLLAADCAVAANSSAMAHMANISYRLGETADADAIVNAFSGSERAKAMIERLLDAPKSFDSISTETWNLGPTLSFDNEQHAFVGESSEQANQMMKAIIELVSNCQKFSDSGFGVSKFLVAGFSKTPSGLWRLELQLLGLWRYQPVDLVGFENTTISREVYAPVNGRGNRHRRGTAK
ncbi:MAG: hypothetical protein R3C03_03725 [Pirellulaceae bacterium]